jgi:hypothetical protein
MVSFSNRNTERRKTHPSACGCHHHHGDSSTSREGIFIPFQAGAWEAVERKTEKGGNSKIFTIMSYKFNLSVLL